MNQNPVCWGVLGTANIARKNWQAIHNSRKCVHCKSVILADRPNLRHQAYCPQPACRRESKRQAQKR